MSSSPISVSRGGLWFLLVLLAAMVSGTSAGRGIFTTKCVPFITLAWILASVSTICSILGMVFVVAYRSNKIVLIGQPFFLCMICFGALLQSTCLYFEVGRIEEIPNITWPMLDRLCILQLWCLYLGMLIVLVALICKLWRAERACQFRRAQRVLVRHVIWPFAAIVAVQLALIVVATTIAPPYWQEIMMNPYADETPALEILNMTDSNDVARSTNISETTNGTEFDTINDTALENELTEDQLDILNDMMMPKCFHSPRPTMEIIKAISHLLIIAAQLLVMWLGYHTRNISDDLVDTELVFYMMFCNLLLYIPFLLLEYGVLPSGKYYHFLQMMCPFLFAMLSLLFLIAPKIYYVFYEKRHGRYPERRHSSLTLNRRSIVGSNRVHVGGLNSSGNASSTLDDSIQTKRKKPETKNPQNEPVIDMTGESTTRPADDSCKDILAIPSGKNHD